MKKLILLLIVLFPISLFAGAKEGDAFYREGSFVNALEEYEKALSEHPRSPELYYNIGNVYFKLNMTGMALAYYQKAFELNPRDASIRHNLNLTLNKTGSSLIPGGMPEGLHRAYYLLSLDELRGLLYITFIVLAFCTAFVMIKKKGQSLCVVFAVLFAISAVWYGVRYSQESKPLAIITVPSAELRGGPGTNFDIGATMPEGQFAYIKDVKDDWHLIVSRADSGVSGWVRKDSIVNLQEI